ncbi:uncharacterized protein JN550_004614 [Neoarthrinium moseri]|uniref:uncharacterized protein n=1 Tax=Neoarthrinium moseri TaxID=1658444 RepID=UPI001FDE91AF|nr:uncharacterized protein JN550_004614 [Neoarthrinium moseri]KAI1871169.1 hypothetical protein JN550_004614 [Neoarthrinium moseri]
MSRSTGLPVAQRWDEQRFRNEAAALELVSTNTTIPVPKLLSWGRDEKGLLFLETELLQRSVCCDTAGDHCRMPKLHGATTGECVDCRRIARDNANRFIYDTVLPQLQILKHNTTGLNGFVIPSRWVTDWDQRELWSPKRSDVDEFVFCHLNLTAHNLMLDSETLEVMALIDWEDAGFFSPEFQQWRYFREELFDLYDDHEWIRKCISLIDR